MSEKKIKVVNLSKSFGPKAVLQNINMEVESGQSFVIMGGSGSGKSVLIKTILGLYQPDDGSSVYINGIDVGQIDIARRGGMLSRIGVLFQGGALFDSMKVWENIAFVSRRYSKISDKAAREMAEEKLALVGLAGGRVLDLYTSELSGGMIKRVALARAIANNPELIFFDEPTAGLDPVTSTVISELIKTCSKNLGATTVTITHDMHCAKVIADKAALLYGGTFIWKGDSIYDSGNQYVEQFVKGASSGPINI